MGRGEGEITGAAPPTRTQDLPGGGFQDVGWKCASCQRGDHRCERGSCSCPNNTCRVARGELSLEELSQSARLSSREISAATLSTGSAVELIATTYTDNPSAEGAEDKLREQLDEFTPRARSILDMRLMTHTRAEPTAVRERIENWHARAVASGIKSEAMADEMLKLTGDTLDIAHAELDVRDARIEQLEGVINSLTQAVSEGREVTPEMIAPAYAAPAPQALSVKAFKKINAVLNACDAHLDRRRGNGGVEKIRETTEELSGALERLRASY